MQGPLGAGGVEGGVVWKVCGRADGVLGLLSPAVGGASS